MLFDPDKWLPVFHVWTTDSAPPEVAALQRLLGRWRYPYRLSSRPPIKPWYQLQVLDEDDVPVARIEHLPNPWDVPVPTSEFDVAEDVLELLDNVRSQFVISVQTGADEPTELVLTATVLGAALLSLQQGLLEDFSALRMLRLAELKVMVARPEFSIEDFVSLHLVTNEEAQAAWLHSHGMEKFGCSNLETFDLKLEVGRDAGKFMNELLLGAALRTRFLMSEPVALPGGAVVVCPSDEARPGVLTIPQEEFITHEGPYLCLARHPDRGDITEVVRGYLHRSLADLADAGEELEYTRLLLPLVRNHYEENASSADFEYYARIPLQIQRGSGTAQESLWVRITRWRKTGLRGTLASDSVLDSGLRVGVEIEFQPDDIEAILLSILGKPIGGKHLKTLLES